MQNQMTEENTAEEIKLIPAFKDFTLEELSQMTPGQILQEGLSIVVNGYSMCHSIRLAADFGVKHKNLLATIRKYAQDKKLAGLHFQPCEYTDPTGRKLPAYVLGKDAFTFVTLSKRGDKANQFRLRYIQAFNKMEKAITYLHVQDPEEANLVGLRDAVNLVLEKHRQNKVLTASVDVLSAQLASVKEDLSEMRRMYEENGAMLQLASSADNWHGGPYMVEDLRKQGFMSTDDIPRRKPQYFLDKKTGMLANHNEILDFIREQMHISRSSHRNPMLRVDCIRNKWCGVFAVHCPVKDKDEENTFTHKLPAGAKTVSKEERKHIRPMVFFTPDGVEELVKRWGKRQRTNAASVV